MSMGMPSGDVQTMVPPMTEDEDLDRDMAGRVRCSMSPILMIQSKYFISLTGN